MGARSIVRGGGAESARGAVMAYGLRVEFAFAYSWPPVPRFWNTGGKGLCEYDLWTVLGGEGRLERDGGSMVLAAGDCLLLRPHQPCVITHNPDAPLVLFPVHFNFIGVDGEVIQPPEASLPPLHRRITDLAFFRGLLERVVAAHMRKAEAEAGIFLRSALVEADSQSGSTARVGDGMRRLAIDMMLKRMVEHPEKDYPIHSLAAEARLSKSRFFTLFKEATGVTPAEHLISARVAKAQTLLRNSGDNIESIAASLGYKSASFFCRQFKKRTGTSPLRYRSVSP